MQFTTKLFIKKKKKKKNKYWILHLIIVQIHMF